MGEELSSRERVKLAYACEEPDRVPVLFRGIHPMDHRWRNQVERAETLLGLGADAVLTCSVRMPLHPEVTTHTWREEDEPYSVLHKEYHTPAGVLHASVMVTEDWQVNDIPFYSDHAWSRGIDYLVKSADDLEALGYLMHDPRQGAPADSREAVSHLRKQADRLGVILQGSMIPAPLYAMGFLGGTRCLTAVRDELDLVEALLARVHEWSRQCLELLLTTPVDVVYRSTCYETVDLFAPSDVRSLFMPILRQDVELCHQAGIPLHSFAQTGVMPFLADYAELGVDIVSSLDTRGSNGMDLAETRRVLAGRCCLMGGADNREPFITAPASEMEETVLEVLRIMAPGGGYILSPAGMIFPEGREENILAFIEAGRRYGRYPLDLPGWKPAPR